MVGCRMKVKLQRMNYNDQYWWNLINAEKPEIFQFIDHTQGIETITGLKRFCKLNNHEIIEINWVVEKPMGDS